MNKGYHYCFIFFYWSYHLSFPRPTLKEFCCKNFVIIFFLFNRAQGPTGKRIFKMLSFRELEYLEFIRKRDIALYGEVLDKLKDIKLGDAPYPPHGDAIPLVQPKNAYNDKPGYQL